MSLENHSRPVGDTAGAPVSPPVLARVAEDEALSKTDLVEVIAHCASTVSTAQFRMLQAISLIHEEHEEDYGAELGERVGLHEDAVLEPAAGELLPRRVAGEHVAIADALVEDEPRGDVLPGAIAVAELASHQSRVLHDTVVNTLGAVANGAIVSGCDAIRARCAADVRAIDAATLDTLWPETREIDTGIEGWLTAGPRENTEEQ